MLSRLSRWVPSLTSAQLIVLTSLLITTLGNFSFFSEALEIYPPTIQNALFLTSLFIALNVLLILLLSALCHQRLIKPILVVVVLLSSGLAYFIDQLGVVIDATMIENVMKTDTGEALDLLTPKLIAYVGLLGILPSIGILLVKLKYLGHKVETIARFKLVLACLALLLPMVWLTGDTYASFVREHKQVRFAANPVFAIFSAGKHTSKAFRDADRPFVVLGQDATISQHHPKNELVILVVGETARADHFSLNGYARETNPQLKTLNIINYPDVWSCGTSTAVSVPCMFSNLGHDAFDIGDANSQSNILDILMRAGVSILWRDNNSSSKGVADRIPYQDFKLPKNNPICDVECRDEGMLADLQSYVDKNNGGDTLIVLHQMGNHGPAYDKRYPAAFEVFKPSCKSNDLNACTQEEIVNAYDNAIRYTDDFLAKVIAFLKTNDARYETAMIYVSDHGESLGEKGLYLHGFPYVLAPEAQKHVPMVMWFGEHFDKTALSSIAKRRTARFTHDNIFPTLLGLFEVRSKLYNPKLDILADRDVAEDSARITQTRPLPLP